MACDGVGPSYTCTRLLQGMAGRGVQGPLFVNRVRKPLSGIEYRSALSGARAALPHRLVAETAARKAERSYLAEIGADDVAYLWPAASLAVYQALAARNIPVVGEGINTLMEEAREILDAVYEAEGLAPGHGITDQRIAEEMRKLELTSALFAPSSGVERSLRRAPIAGEDIIGASYGVALPEDVPPLRAVPEAGLTVLFVGFGSVRKGLHQLLKAWARAGLDGRLVLAGDIEPALRQRFADHLNRDDVEVRGFMRDVSPLYREADIFVFPSFEEGDPLVTYEAAAHGLPIIASRAGAGRMGEETGCTLAIDPAEPDTIAEALVRLARDGDARRHWAEQTRAAIADYSWTKVGGRRAEALSARFGV